MKQLVLMAMMAGVMAVHAAPTAKGKKTEGEEKEVKVRIEQFPKLGKAATLEAPSIAGASVIGSVHDGRPRRWIVMEAKYKTHEKCIDRLTFVWHVLLETKSASSKDREGQKKMAPYSYFTVSVNYANIPKGTHAACACLHPSYYEQYGEPKAIGLVIKDGSGNVIAGDCESDIKGIVNHPKSLEKAFWNDSKIMDAKEAGEPMIERRQGLVDRSKTIWALVNPNDYEMTVQ